MKAIAIKYSFLVVIFSLFLYSFTQVDLSLTLSQVSIWQVIQKSFQQIGWFNRPLSTLLFVCIITAMFSYYIWFLKKVWRKQIKIKEVWILIAVSTIILAFSYNAFSYDLFNYIFDAKIITHYHENPYVHRALDYPGDEMLSFMRWTHRVYPYGPVWLALTVPLSFLGAKIFLLTFFLFKFLIAGFYVGSTYLIYKINKRLNPENAEFNTLFFALNPLVIVESLVSSHNDIAMVFFALLGIYLLLLKKKILSILAIIISSQVKIPTIALIAPVLLMLWPFNTKIKLDNNRLTQLLVLAMLGVSIFVLTRIEIQPWYFLWVLPFIALLRPNRYVVALAIGLSAGLLARYSVFLYYGSWDGIALPLRNGFTIIAPIVVLGLVFLQSTLRKGVRGSK